MGRASVGIVGVIPAMCPHHHIGVAVLVHIAAPLTNAYDAIPGVLAVKVKSELPSWPENT